MKLITGADPVPLDGALGPLVLVPVVGAGAIAFDQQVVDGAVGDIGPGLIDNPRLVSRHQLSGRARSHPPGSIRDEDVEDFGAADPVEDLHPKAVPEPLVERLGQRFTRRDGLPDA